MRSLAVLACALALAAPARGAEATSQVMLTDAGPNKIAVVKAIREATGLGLREAKALIDAPKPALVRDGLPRAQAEEVAARLVAAGAKAEVRGGGAAASPAPAPPSGARGWAVHLESFGTSKIMVIKVVRDRTGLGLADTKKLVESAPATVGTGLSQQDADRFVAELRADRCDGGEQASGRARVARGVAPLLRRQGQPLSFANWRP